MEVKTFSKPDKSETKFNLLNYFPNYEWLGQIVEPIFLQFWNNLPCILVAYFIFRFFKSLDCDLSLRCIEITNHFFTKTRNLKDKVIWITGASSGIGEYLAYELSTHRVKLVLSGRNLERLEKVKQNCLFKGLTNGDVITVVFDVRDRSTHEPSLHSVLEHFGRLDVFVNNAGTSQRCRFEAIDSRVDIDLFDNNVFGGISLTRVVLKHWLDKAAPGHIMVTSSIVGRAALPECSTYAASKHALHGYYESLRCEVTSKDIAITMICSGPVKTGITAVSYTGNYGERLGATLPINSRRMEASRHAKLMTLALASRLEEAWITIQPFLWYCYAVQYFPTISRRYLINFANLLSKTRDE